MDWPDDPDEIYGIPPGTTKKAVPELSENQYAFWMGSGWIVTNNPPQMNVSTTPPKEVPESITKYQAKMALLEIGLFEQIETYVRDSNDAALQISWYDAENFYRNNSFIESVGLAFNLSSDQIDDLFILGNNY
jgi:hypothetical protein